MVVHIKGLCRLVVVVVVTFMVGVGTAGGTLVFEDDRPLTLTWEQSKAGVDVAVCNIGNSGLQSLQATLSGFNFRVGGEAVVDEVVLKPPYIISTLDAGVCTQVRIQATDGPTPDPGEYKGLLVLSDLSAGVISRQEVTIELAPAEGAVDDIILTATRNGPWLRTVSLDAPNLPLKPAGPGETLILPEKDTHIGIVYNEGRLGHVYVNGEPSESQKGVVLLPIRVGGLDTVGAYSGKLNMAGIGDDEGAIRVQVKVTDHIGWAIGAIIIGVAIPFLVLFYMQWWLPNYKLKKRRDLLVNKYQDAEGQFMEHYGSKFGEYTPNYDAIEKYNADFDKARIAYTQSNRLSLDMDSEDFKKLIKTLETAENDAQQFGDPAGFGKLIEGLQTALEDFAKFLCAEFLVDRQPAFVRPATDLLKGGPLAVGAAQKITIHANGYVNLIKAWQVMAAQIKRYELWGYKLSDKKDMTAGDQEVLQRARAKVMEAKNEMLDAMDAATLADLGSAEDLRRAYTQLAYLGSRYGVWEGPEEEKNQEQRDEGFRAMKLCWKIELPAIKLDGDKLMYKWRQQAKFVSIESEKVAKIEQVIRWLGDAGVIGLAVAVAILTGLTQLYFSKTFGTFEDYLSVILLGTGTQVTLKGLTETIKKLRTPLKA